MVPIQIVRCLLVASAACLIGQTSIAGELAFEKIQLTTDYFAEGGAAGDFNQDGQLDIVSGPNWFPGPDFKTTKRFYDGKAFPNDRGYSDNFFSFVDDFSGDGLDDVLVVGLPGTPAYWYENSASDELWKKHLAFPIVDNEAPTYSDITGDGQPELVFHYQGKLGYAQPSSLQPYEPWSWTAISEQGRWHKYQHGLGIGDLDKDGLVDFLMVNGWWKHPKNWDGKTPWEFHALKFAPGGAGIHVLDLDADGDQDVVTGLHAHGYGLVWHERESTDGTNKLRQHVLMGDRPERSPLFVNFSQLHAVEVADMNGDDVPDIVTGKCYWAHNGHDPGAKDPAVLYVFVTQRTSAGVTFKPVQVDDNSGIGRQITLVDLNGDQRLDIITANKKGTFAFLSK